MILRICPKIEILQNGDLLRFCFLLVLYGGVGFCRLIDIIDMVFDNGHDISGTAVTNTVITKRLQYLYSFKISRDKWNESSDKSNWNVIVPWSDSKGNAITATVSSVMPNLTTNMSLGPAMMERTSSLKDNIILSGELSMINQGQIYVCGTNKLSFTVKRRPVCDLMLYFYARQWTT